MNVRRTLELWVLPLLMLAAMALPFVAWGDRLPDEAAAHWGFNGQPDRGDDPAVAFVIFSGIFTAAWIAVVTAIQTRRIGGTDARGVVAGLYWFGTFLAALFVLGLSKSLDVTSWEQAGELPAWQAFAVMLVALPAALLGWWLAAGHDDLSTPAEAREVTPMRAAAGERLVWSGHATNRKLLIVLAVPVLVLATMALFVPEAWWVLAVSGSAVVIAGLLLTRATATIGPDGVRVRLGPFGWPGKRIPLDAVTAVAVEDVVPMAYGGWGWRIRPGTQAFIVRCGPGLRIQRKQGADIVVTVDDADRGASVLAGYLETAGKTGA